ncbi:MAG: peptidylprolyl isomerase [Methanomassiliicoccales archaeon]|jgi:peptidyl-prolyl cis-trans isomerase C
MVTEVHAAHILVKTEAHCKDLLTQIKAGKKFSEVAMKNSECPSGKKGGDLGWFTRGKMVREFENPAFAGKKGDIVGPFKSQFGWHLMWIMDQK